MTDTESIRARINYIVRTAPHTLAVIVLAGTIAFIAYVIIT